MDMNLWAFLGLIGVMAVNQLVMRVGGLKARAVVFYSLQLMNLIVGTALLWFGMPGFEDWPAVSWMIGLLLFFRVVQNNISRAEWLRHEARDRDQDARREAIAEALRRGKE
ncbi:MAG: hypothetical protein ACJAZO_002180 [Myxococcota bacterium]|jgi:hypothetical protein